MENRIEQMEKLLKKQTSPAQFLDSPEIPHQQQSPRADQTIQQQQNHTKIFESPEASSLLMNGIATDDQIFTDMMAPDNNKSLVNSDISAPSIPILSFEEEPNNNAPSINYASHTFDPNFDMILEEMNGLTIRDYQRTRYIGYSSGIECLRPNFFYSNRKHRLSQEPSWFVQKINHEEEDHVIMKSKEAFQPQFLYYEPTLERFKMLKDLCMTDELADILIHV